MRRKYLYSSVVYLMFTSNLFSQSYTDTLRTLPCLEEIRNNCKGDTLRLDLYSDNKFRKDTALIRYLLEAKQFTRRTLNRIRKTARFFKTEYYERIADQDSVLHYMDLALLNIFEIKFYYKTYKNNILHRGLSLEQAYRPSCQADQVIVSFLLPRFYPAINLLTSQIQKELIGCGLLLIDEWDQLQQDYRRLKGIKMKVQ